MVIAIIIVYIASIIAVNFFGLSIKNFEGTIYVKSIVCDVLIQREEDNEADKRNIPNDDRTWYIFSYFDGDYTADNLTENPNTVTIQMHVYPENADNKRVKFVYDKEAADGLCVFDEDIATIFFLKKGGISVTVEAADGSKVKQKLFILAN